ncbi:MAG: hypothetical protein VB860_08605 [Dehalococcoidia bacterium]
MNIKISGLSHKKALILALFGIVARLIVSVTSFANTSSSTSIDIASGSVEFGFTVAQDETATTAVTGVTTASIAVSDGSTFAVGDHILIETDGDGDPTSGTQRGWFTVTAKPTTDSMTLLVEADGTTDPQAAGIVSTDVLYEPTVYDSSHTKAGISGYSTSGSASTWTPALNSATSVLAGNDFIINLKGLTSGDSAFVEVLNTNPNELVKNYTYLNRTFGVYVYCDSVSDCSSGPYSATTTAGQLVAANDVSGETINAVGDLLTLANARVQFNLIGDYVYAITIEGGALFTIDTATGTGDSLSPSDQIGITAR